MQKITLYFIRNVKLVLWALKLQYARAEISNLSPNRSIAFGQHDPTSVNLSFIFRMSLILAIALGTVICI